MLSQLPSLLNGVFAYTPSRFGLSDWRLHALLTVFAPFLLTYIVTLVRFKIAVRSQTDERKPPKLHHMFPGIGSAIAFGLNTVGFTTSIVKNHGSAIPVRVWLCFFEMSFISGSNNIIWFWNQSQQLTNRPYRTLAVGNMFGMPRRAVSFYVADDSGISLHPHPASRVKPEDRIQYVTHTSLSKLLTGPGMKPLVDRFTSNLEYRLSRFAIGKRWLDLPDLCEFLQNVMFHSTLEAVFGPAFFSLNPSFCQEFWQFSKSIPCLSKGFPRWLTPGSYRARDRCLESVKKWHRYLYQQIKIGQRGPYPDWDQRTGAEIMKSRHEYYSRVEVLDSSAIASEDLGMIWGMSANSIISTFWLVLHVFSDSSLLSRVRCAITDCQIQGPVSHTVQFDAGKLCESPLMQSIYAETLRLHVAAFIIRSPERADLKLDQWIFAKDSIMTVSSYTAQTNEDIWSTGYDGRHYPLDKFWADRFLIYPGINDSGPLKNKSIAKVEHPLEEGTADEPKFSLHGLEGAWIPYGGGQRICPGRHFAKQEMLMTLAILCSRFEVEICNGKGADPEHDWTGFGFGALSPKHFTPFKIRASHC